MLWLQRISPCLRVSGMATSNAGWIEPLRTIYEHELVLFESGDFVVEIANRNYSCRGGSFLIVPPGVWQTTRMLSCSGRRRWVHFD